MFYLDRSAGITSPFGLANAAAIGLTYAPGTTINVALAGLNYYARTTLTEMEQRDYERRFGALMMERMPWKNGEHVQRDTQNAINRLSMGREGIVLVEPYYYDMTAAYTDATFGENKPLYAYGYRLHPCAVFAMNIDPDENFERVLLETIVFVAFLRGTDLYGNSIMYMSTWKQSLPLDTTNAFYMPSGATLNRAADERSVLMMEKLFSMLYAGAVATDKSDVKLMKDAPSLYAGTIELPTPIEQGFPALRASGLWFGSEPFPELDNFVYEVIGADLRARGISLPVWFRPRRGVLG